MLSEFQVEKQAAMDGALQLRYPEAMQEQNREGRVVVQFVVDTTGIAELRTFHVIEATDAAFAAATKAAVATARFSPAEVAGRKVRQLVQLPVTFSLNR